MSKKNVTPTTGARKPGLVLDDDHRELLSGSPSDDVDDRAAQTRGSGMGRTKAPRHDRKYVPRGHEVVGDRLYRKAKDAVLSDRVTEDADRSLILGLREMLDSFLDDVDDFTDADRKACADLYEKLHGHPFGEAWRMVLARVLRQQAEVLMQVRIPGAPSSWPVAMTPKEMIDKVREQAGDEVLPGWLTAKGIAAVLPTINLGGKGGKGKTAGRTPEDAVRWLAKQAPKRTTAKRRGYSKG